MADATTDLNGFDRVSIALYTMRTIYVFSGPYMKIDMNSSKKG